MLIGYARVPPVERLQLRISRDISIVEIFNNGAQYGYRQLQRPGRH